MEGSEGEAVFKSLNLDPQVFLNETLNAVDDLLDEAFDCFHQEASTIAKSSDTGRSQSLAEGVAYIRNMVRSELDTRLDGWGQYCLLHCFAVPKGFSLPENKESPGESLTDHELLNDHGLDAQLTSLRNRLAEVGKESAELNQELQTLERQSASSGRCVALIKEALQPYHQIQMQGLFEEMIRTASELQTKIKQRARRVEDIANRKAKRICDPNKDLFASDSSKALSNTKLEDLQVFYADLKKL